MGSAMTHEQEPSIVAIASVVTAACCCAYQAALYRTQFLPRPASTEFIKERRPRAPVAPRGAVRDVEAGQRSPPSNRPLHITRSTSPAPMGKRPAALPPLVREPTDADGASCSAPTSPRRAPPDGVLVDAFFYQFWMPRTQLPPHYRQVDDCVQMRPADAEAHSVDALPRVSIADSDRSFTSSGASALMCRSPTSSCKLSELRGREQRSPSSVADFHEFEL